MQVDLWLWLWGLTVGVWDAGGSGVTEDKRPIVEHVVHSRLANVIQASPRLSLAFGFPFGRDWGSQTEE